MTGYMHLKFGYAKSWIKQTCKQGLLEWTRKIWGLWKSSTDDGTRYPAEHAWSRVKNNRKLQETSGSISSSGHHSRVQLMCRNEADSAGMRLACNATGMASTATAKCCRRVENAMAQMDSKLETSRISDKAARSGILL